MATDNPSNGDLATLLRWHLDAGVDETIGTAPLNRYGVRETLAPTAPSATSHEAGVKASPQRLNLIPALHGDRSETPTHIAQQCRSLTELKTAVENYNGCALKSFATRTVFADGVPDAKVMVIGEAPGEDEDRQGLPFVGVSGKLLDRMLAAVDLDRARNVYITNVVFWRPPGNRKPTGEEIALCLPFVQRHIELLDPSLLLLVGGPAASTILANAQGITKLRGRWFEYESPGLSRPIPTMATFHPAYLLRSPNQKRLAWRDLLAFKQRLDSVTAS